MKSYGKIVDYNGMYGHIKSVDGKNYIVLDKDMLESNLNVADYVEFVGENYNTVETNIDIARFVKKLEKNKIKAQEKNSYNR